MSKFLMRLSGPRKNQPQDIFFRLSPGNRTRGVQSEWDTHLPRMMNIRVFSIYAFYLMFQGVML